MRPGAVPKTPLPENATALQRILAHPATSRLFGGAAMGGMELGQEAVGDENLDWRKAAVATGFGLVFNRPTRLGEAITELGARPARAIAGVPHPTVAQAVDAKVMGPGVTEDVFHGAHEQDPSAAETANAAPRAEQATLEPPTPDVHDVARRMNPELFAHYDDLLARQEALRGWVAEQGEEAPVARGHLTATDSEIAAVGPEVAAAYRRAADAIGAPASRTEERFPSMAAMLAAQGEKATEGAPVGTPEAPARSIEDQRAFIQNDATQQYLAAGEPPERASALGALTD